MRLSTCTSIHTKKQQRQQPQPQQQLAYSLLEVMIASAIFATVLSMVFETSSVSSQVLHRSDTVYGLELEARGLMKEIISDLSGSTWLLPFDEDGDKSDLSDRIKDRNLRYYPYINVQGNGTMGVKFGHFSLSSDKKVTPASFPKKYLVPDEHYYPSQEIVFVKLARSVSKDDPKKIRPTRTSFNTEAIALGDFWKGPVVTEMELKVAGAEIGSVSLRMERDTSGDLREYSYGVRLNTQTGRRELCKYYTYRNSEAQTATATGTPKEMKVLSVHVDRIVFDTYRTRAGLSTSQILVQVFMSKRGRSGQVVTHKTTTTIAMRSSVDPEYAAQIDSWLGVGGEFPVKVVGL